MGEPASDIEVLSPLQLRARGLRGFLDARRGILAKLSPHGWDEERLLAAIMDCLAATPALALKCDPNEIMRAVAECARLGLYPGGTLGHIYVIPFLNRKQNRYEAQIVTGYKGLIELAYRSGMVLDIGADVRRESDRWEHTRIPPRLVHEPDLTIPEAERGEILTVYAWAVLSNGYTKHEAMNVADVDAIRQRAPGYKIKSGPHHTHPDEMRKKTVIRRLCKTLRMSSEDKSGILARAIQLDTMAEASEPQFLPEVPDIEITQVESDDAASQRGATDHEA